MGRRLQSGGMAAVKECHATMNQNPQRDPWWAQLIDGVVNAINWGDFAEGLWSLLGEVFGALLSALLEILGGL